MVRSSRVAQWGVVVALVPVLVACGGGSDGGSDGDSGRPDGGPTSGRPLEFRPVVASDTGGGCLPSNASDVPGAPIDPCDEEQLTALDCADPPSPPPATETMCVCSEATKATDSQPAFPPVKYVLAPARIVGGVDDAGYDKPEGSDQWAVTLDLDQEGTEELASWSTEARKGPEGDLFAIVLGDRVLSAPYFDSPMEDGQAQISGTFTEDEARDLAAAIEAGG